MFIALVAINVVAAAAEVLGVFSVLPFLALASDPAACVEKPLLRYFYELLGFSSPLRFVGAAGIATIAALLTTNSIAVTALWFRTWFCNEVATEMSDRLLRRYLRQPYAFFLTHNSSVLGKDLLNEVHGFFQCSLEPLTILLARSLQIAAIVLALMLYDWRTTAFAVLIFGGFYCGVYAMLRGRLRRWGTVRFEANEARFRLATEALSGIKELKLFGREQWYSQHFQEASERYAATQERMTLYSFTPRYLLEILVFTAVIVAVLLKMAKGESFEELTPWLSVFAVGGIRLMPAIQMVFQYAAALAGSDTAVRRLHALFATVGGLTSPETNIADCFPQSTPLRLRRGIELKNLTFAYANNSKTILDGISLVIPAGSCVGICGPSGSGKTTLLDLTLGLLSPDQGNVLIDGVVLDASTTPSWQRNIGYVPQSIFLIDGTIAENIAFSTDRAAIDMAAVDRAAKLAHLQDVIASSPDGLATLVGERGVRLSGGQRQRVAIARALYRDPDVLFFDEATSALDVASEALVVEAIQQLAGVKTIVIVAHRVATLRYCDAIYVLRAGRLVRRCSYDELANESINAHGAT